MKNLFKLLKMILDILNVLKDSDKDGVPDIFDKKPNDPNEK